MEHAVSIRLDNNQKNSIIHAIQNNTNLILHIHPSQLIANQDNLLLTKRQANQIMNGIISNKVVTLRFSKHQVQKIRSQIGSGILDSLGSFFNSAKNYISSGVSKVGNYFKPATPAPKQSDQLIRKPKTKIIPNSNADLAKKYKNLTKINYNPKNTNPDHGQQYDHLEPSYKPPVKTGFDAFADKVNNFNKVIDNAFSY